MKNTTDQFFKNSEHQKNLEIRPELWNRLERKLDHQEGRKKKSRPWLVAASFTLVFTLSALLYLNIDQYSVEDMNEDAEPNFYKEEVAGLDEVYHIPPSIFVNPEVLRITAL